MLKLNQEYKYSMARGFGSFVHIFSVDFLYTNFAINTVSGVYNIVIAVFCYNFTLHSALHRKLCKHYFILTVTKTQCSLSLTHTHTHTHTQCEVNRGVFKMQPK